MENAIGSELDVDSICVCDFVFMIVLFRIEHFWPFVRFSKTFIVIKCVNIGLTIKSNVIHYFTYLFLFFTLLSYFC